MRVGLLADLAVVVVIVGGVVVGRGFGLESVVEGLGGVAGVVLALVGDLFVRVDVVGVVVVHFGSWIRVLLL